MRGHVVAEFCDGITQQKPQKRIEQADLAQNIKRSLGIVPYAELHHKVDHHADRELGAGDDARAREAALPKRAFVVADIEFVHG